MSRILCIANQKGGVGKTTTAINVSSGIAKSGESTLLVDLDPQCNATTGLGMRPAVRHPLLNGGPWHDDLCPSNEPNLCVLPGCRSFEDIRQLAIGDPVGRRVFSDRIAELKEDFSTIVIDCPPSLGHLTETALQSSTEVVMPIQCEYFAMEGLTQMIEIIRRVMDRPDNEMEFGGIVLTMYDHTLELTREVDDEVRDFFGDVVFETVIPRDVAVSEAPSHGVAVLDHAPKSRGARAYIELCMEVLNRV
ncbi:MAG: ParA family protein [Planctomycetales bacterium]|nr:ParA family protein [Planctomycetales bacterium]